MRAVNCDGYSLIELLVGLSVSIMITMAALALMTTATTTQSRLDGKTVLSLEISRLLTWMESDIRRAGLCYQCGDTSPYHFKHGSRSHLLAIGGELNQSEGQCLRFSYQQTETYPTHSMGKDDAKGFRFDADSQAIEIYENHREIKNWSCESTYWRDISSHALKINYLTFSRDEQRTASGRVVTSLTIKLSAALRDKPSESETLSRTLVLVNTVHPS
ncbi:MULTISPECIES: type II secretion system protein J [unclassified Salinivibrio]|uniref:PulJ/GspJ family protein n=1 Tax=unclassified Salinivibrio TaxID=2636825 RepID=UPI00128E5F60|nr:MULTISPECIES: hypothetical protein [unclassified Salinivibrio]MPS33514.1 hypothetical protein [Salinivibrio sp. VYel7]MPX94898.1 hypothetical protein [Salinivibrio sp. VYel9]MPX97894.1 hypothetical protein [Salinivibrio sp. VYel6]MPY01128.1 hypothetical protein [Salinivibrio sp. VYel4]MPY04204.1 hypothetical protein [Salinivibrio sp. VYel5]